jgi:hypothetical protein
MFLCHNPSGGFDFVMWRKGVICGHGWMANKGSRARETIANDMKRVVDVAQKRLAFRGEHHGSPIVVQQGDALLVLKAAQVVETVMMVSPVSRAAACSEPSRAQI